jgi:D-threo-aldose 1-dehydrogenase
MDPLATRPLGRTGREATQLGFGTGPLGDLFTVVSDRDAEAAIDAAWDAGLRYFDTSPWYGRGQSEHRMGRGLYHRPRDGFVLSTKVGRLLTAPRDQARFDRGQWRGGLPFQHRFDYSYDGIMRSFEDSLQRLGMPRVDLLLVHDLDILFHMTPERVTAHLHELATSGWRALSSLKEAGLIGGIGAGINLRGMMARFLDLADIDVFLVAMPYTLAEQSVLEDEFPRCAKQQVGIVIGAVFASGILATGPVPGAKYDYADATPAVMERVGRIQAVCARHGVSLAAAALQFPLGHPSVASVIPGALNADQVRRNLAAFRVPIPADLWAELKHEGLLRADAPVPHPE